MPLIPYLSHGRGVPIDPLTGLPTKKKNPYTGSFTGSLSTLPPGVSFGGGYGGGQIPGVSGQVTIPGYNPDFRGLLTSNPNYQSLMGDLGADRLSDAAGVSAANRRALIGFGQQFDPNTLTSTFGADSLKTLGPDFAGDVAFANPLAQRNTEEGLSVKAQHDRQFNANIAAITNFLASRGLLRSGAAGIEMGRAQQDYKQGMSNSTSELADLLSGYVAGFAERERQRKTTERQGIIDVENQVRTDPANQPRPAEQAILAGIDPVTGKPFYKKPDGTLVDGDGRVYTPAPPVTDDRSSANPQQSLADILGAVRRRSQAQRLGFQQ